MKNPQILTDADLPEYLRSVGLSTQSLPQTAALEVERLRDGNINWVRRVYDPNGPDSWVVKQARTALEQFPEYSASTERIVCEARYYEVAARIDPARCPGVHHFDAVNRVLVLEDLSRAQRLDDLLAEAPLDDPTLLTAARDLGGFLAAVHTGTRKSDLGPRFVNDEMRRLHGDHIFLFPYRKNDFPLAPAVARRARAIWDDAELVSRIDAAYSRYLDSDEALVHADVQPTNILLADRGAVLIDAEIAHLGDPAFDIGVLLAHLRLPAILEGSIEPTPPAVDAAWDAYTRASDPAECPDYDEVNRYAAIELLRRTLGAARTPATEKESNAVKLIRFSLEQI